MSVHVSPGLHIDSCESPIHYTYRWGAYDTDGSLINHALAIVCLPSPHANLLELLAEQAQHHDAGRTLAAWAGGRTFPSPTLAGSRPDAVYQAGGES